MSPRDSIAAARSPRIRGGFTANPRRGSLLIVAMLISAIIGISLVSYIKLSTHSLTMATRSFYQAAAVNLTEMGVEEAMHCYNRLDDFASAASAWSGITNADGTTVAWSVAGDNSVTTTMSNISLGPNTNGTVKVYCSNFNPGNSSPFIVAKATVTLPQGPSLEKWLLVRLRKRSYWANGLVARNTMVWNGGNATADSWNSDPDNNPATPGVPYGSGTGPAQANVSVGTPNPANGSIDVGGGAIYGELLNAGGTINKSSSAILASTTGGTGWDTNLISNDFDATFPTVRVPEVPALNVNLVGGSAPIAFPDTLPRTGDVAYNGVYYYQFAGGYGLSASGAASNMLTVNKPVVILATANSGSNTIDLGGNASIEVASTGTLTIYTDGNIEAAGNGIANATSTPTAFQIFGTNTAVGGQTIRFVGNGTSIAAIYAPNATFQLRGNGSLHGAVVANSINLNGNAAFHYDEALATSFGGNPYGIISWRELQSDTERNEYRDELNF